MNPEVMEKIYAIREERRLNNVEERVHKSIILEGFCPKCAGNLKRSDNIIMRIFSMTKRYECTSCGDEFKVRLSDRMRRLPALDSYKQPDKAIDRKLRRI